MSLVTRGLGPVPRLVTAGLGGSFVLGAIGCVIVKTLDITSTLLKTVGLDSLSVKALDLSSTVSKSMGVSDISKTSSTGDLEKEIHGCR